MVINNIKDLLKDIFLLIKIIYNFLIEVFILIYFTVFYPLNRFIKSLSKGYFEHRADKIFFEKYPSMRKIQNVLNNIFEDYSPFEISIEENNDMSLTYGETPWLTISKIINEIEIFSDDIFVELGSGMGFFSFFMNQVFGINSIGLEIREKFVIITNRIVDILDLRNIKFIKTDIFEYDFSYATIIYLTATCFSSRQLEILGDKFNSLQVGTRLIMVSQGISLSTFRLLKRRIFNFSWGPGSVFFYEKIK